MAHDRGFDRSLRTTCAVVVCRSGICLLLTRNRGRGGYGSDRQVKAARVSAGAALDSVEHHVQVQSVSTDHSGRVLAVGASDGRCCCYDAEPGGQARPALRWTARHKNKARAGSAALGRRKRDR